MIEKKLTCKYCGKEMDLKYLPHLQGLISHPNCYNKYCNEKYKDEVN